MDTGRRELYRLALDAIAAQLAGEAQVRHAVVGEMYHHPAARGGLDLVVMTGTLVAIAREVAAGVGRRPEEVLSRLHIEDAEGERGERLQSSLILAATVMHEDESRGTLLALENSGWIQARAEAAKLGAQLLRLVANGDAVVRALARQVEGLASPEVARLTAAANALARRTDLLEGGCQIADLGQPCPSAAATTLVVRACADGHIGVRSACPSHAELLKSAERRAQMRCDECGAAVAVAAFDPESD